MRPKSLDHVAYWLADRDAVAEFLERHLGMHVIDRTDRFTLMGSDARRGKLTLFAAEGPRERGSLLHVALRVSDLLAAEAELPAELELERPNDRELYFDVGAEGVRLGLVEAPTEAEYNLDHVALLASDPDATATAYERFGFRSARAGFSGWPRVEVGGAFVELRRGEAADSERPLLNHLAVLVDSAEDHIEAAQELGAQIDDIVDAPNTYAVFLRGPEGVRIEYVEHKPSFSLS
jgi:catechol 2,3-dioxygenase-like lactoylglutathione lyase family enzyme